MTIAYDKRTGAIVGQVTTSETDDASTVRILTRDGYKVIARDTVRVEKRA